MRVVFALLFVFGCFSAAISAESRVTVVPTIDFTQELKGIGGLPLIECKAQLVPGQTCPADQVRKLTLGDISTAALEVNLDEDRGLSPNDKFQHDQLARKIYGNSSVALSAEDIALIKNRIGKAFGPAQVGAAWPLLDPSVK